MNVFLGLNISAEELGVKRQNMWAFASNNINQDGLDYFNMDVQQVGISVKTTYSKCCATAQALDADIPLMFISFPSAKDPEWSNHPGDLLLCAVASVNPTCAGRENKTTCAIVTLANWEWFKSWQDKQVGWLSSEGGLDYANPALFR